MSDTPSTPHSARHQDPSNPILASVEYAPPTPPSAASSPRTSVANRLSNLSLRNFDLESVSFTPQQSPSKKRARSPIIEPQGRQEDLHKLSCNNGRVAIESLLNPNDDHQDSSLKDVDMQILRPVSIREPSHEPRSKSQPPHDSTANPPRRKLSPKPKLKRKKSPPPPSIGDGPSEPIDEEDLFTWHDHEITGHLMQDADDDGYGINGVGFRPTAALAYARSQRRKQQIDDWKARESKDARQMRSERRRKVDDGGSSGPPSFTGVPSNESESIDGEGTNNKRRSVRFA